MEASQVNSDTVLSNKITVSPNTLTAYTLQKTTFLL